MPVLVISLIFQEPCVILTMSWLTRSCHSVHDTRRKFLKATLRRKSSSKFWNITSNVYCKYFFNINFWLQLSGTDIAFLPFSETWHTTCTLFHMLNKRVIQLRLVFICLFFSSQYTVLYNWKISNDWFYWFVDWLIYIRFQTIAKRCNDCCKCSTFDISSYNVFKYLEYLWVVLLISFWLPACAVVCLRHKPQQLIEDFSTRGLDCCDQSFRLWGWTCSFRFGLPRFNTWYLECRSKYKGLDWCVDNDLCLIVIYRFRRALISSMCSVLTCTLLLILTKRFV